jgi:glyoxylase-like metal-dependent hydrolase (beta-lactamase superfamily II)
MTTRVGPWAVETIEAEPFVLDGGAMFGIVPRPRWSEVHPPDGAGRIPLAARCLLLRHDGGAVVLVDSGMGTRWLGRARETFQVEDRGGIAAALAARGIPRESVTDVVVTHLHFDHAGGLVETAPDRKPRPTFPAARVHVQARHLAWARSPSPRDRGSFRNADFVPIEEQGLLVVHDGPGEVVPDLPVRLSHGHTPAMQMPLVVSGDLGVVFPSDLIPTLAHVQLPWVMAYDNQPVVTVGEKEALLVEACDRSWIVVSDHDPRVPAYRVVRDGARFVPVPCEL